MFIWYRSTVFDADPAGWRSINYRAKVTQDYRVKLAEEAEPHKLFHLTLIQ